MEGRLGAMTLSQVSTKTKERVGACLTTLLNRMVVATDLGPVTTSEEFKALRVALAALLEKPVPYWAVCSFMARADNPTETEGHRDS